MNLIYILLFVYRLVYLVLTRQLLLTSFFDNTGSTTETWVYSLDMPEDYKHFSKTKPMKLEHFKPVISWWNEREEITEEGFNKAKKYVKEELAEKMVTI